MIQAQSLGHLLHLADDPPLKYPSERPNNQGSLILYLARVPGSKDFFLTTVKPLEKVVRAGDVESCLYYVHLNTERDADLLREAEESLLAENPNMFPPMTGVVGQKSTVKRKPVLPSRPGGLAHSATGPANSKTPRFYFNHDHAVTRKPIGLENVSKGGEMPARRPLGPRPLNGMQERDPNATASNRGAPSSVQGFTESPTIPAQDHYTPRQRELDKLYESNADIDNHFAGSLYSIDISSSKSSMTLIRRYDGSQSNVGDIGANGKIRMYGDGYRKFKQPAPAIGNSNTASDFSTCIEREGSAPLQFSTLWKSICRFSGSIGGRTLRCTHMAGEAPQSSAVMSELRFNLPSSQALRSAPKRPLSDIETSSKRSSFVRLHQRGKSEITLKKEDDIGAETFSQERMDLSLGQELAGGGFGGKNAKIAKLIVYPAGYPMLDLLVAGNLSVFSKIYERNGPDLSIS